METFKRIMDLIDVNLIFCLPTLLLTIILADLIFKKRIKAEKAYEIIRWFIIIYTILSILYWLSGMLFQQNEFAFLNRATGPYWFAYWLMLSCSTILPFILFVKKIPKNAFYLLLIVVLLKIGRYYEIFVILVTGFHRDYLPSSNSGWYFYPSPGFIIIMLQGFILGIILLGIVQLISTKETAHNIS